MTPFRSSLTHDAWEAGRLYRSTRAIPADLLRSPIYRAWERSHLQGANPWAMRAEQLSAQETERLIGQNRALIDAARPYVRMLSQAAGQERHAVMVGDRHGILLDVQGDEQTIHGPEPFPSSGSLLSEGIAGANGIGTPLAEAEYVEIAASEHFIEGFHPFTCQGIPMYDNKQQITGVLSISVRSPRVGQRLKEILLCASRGVEADLMITSLEADIRNVLAASPDDYRPLETLKQDLIQSHQAARLKLEIGSRMVASNRLEYALQLVQQAEHSIQLFRRRATLWQELASSDVGIVQPVCVTDRLHDLLDLLKIEITIRKVDVIPSWIESVNVIADSQELSRKLLRCLLQTFEQTTEGGSITINVEKLLADGLARVRFVPSSRLRRGAENHPIPWVVSFPLATSLP